MVSIIKKTILKLELCFGSIINPLNPHNQMERLTIKELAPYLPYGLKLYIWNGGYEKPIEYPTLIGLHGDSIIQSGYRFRSIHCGDEIFSRPEMSNSLSIIKPLLRPLSYLTEEIEHNGEKFVPMEEIAKIECPNITGAADKIHSITTFKRGLYFNSSQMGVTYRYEGVTVEITHFKDDIFHKRVVNGNDSWVFSYFHNYPAIIQKLHEWHFDTANLLGRNLALPIDGKEVKR